MDRSEFIETIRGQIPLRTNPSTAKGEVNESTDEIREARPSKVHNQRAKALASEEGRMSYIDGFVIAVPAGNKDKYVEHASVAAKLFKEYGATRVVECWGDDVPEGKVTDFRKSVQAEEGEVVVYGWIEYPSKDVRDRANAELWKDPRMKEVPAMPFDGKRMVFGGFQVILDE